MSVEIKLYGVEDTNGISWSILDTNCKSLPDLNVGINRVYRKRCDLALDQSYKLQCNGVEKSTLGTGLGGGWIHYGWRSNYIVIESSVYCQFAKDKTVANIKITGKRQFLSQDRLHEEVKASLGPSGTLKKNSFDSLPYLKVSPFNFF